MANASAEIRVEIAEAILPRELVAKLARFLESGPSGQIVLDVANGTITGVKLTEAIRLDKRKS